MHGQMSWFGKSKTPLSVVSLSANGRSSSALHVGSHRLRSASNSASVVARSIIVGRQSARNSERVRALVDTVGMELRSVKVGSRIRTRRRGPAKPHRAPVSNSMPTANLSIRWSNASARSGDCLL
jgi:hypothetical protein